MATPNITASTEKQHTEGDRGTLLFEDLNRSNWGKIIKPFIKDPATTNFMKDTMTLEEGEHLTSSVQRLETLVRESISTPWSLKGDKTTRLHIPMIEAMDRVAKLCDWFGSPSSTRQAKDWAQTERARNLPRFQDFSFRDNLAQRTTTPKNQFGLTLGQRPEILHITAHTSSIHPLAAICSLLQSRLSTFFNTA